MNEPIIDYLKTNKDNYTKDSLIQQLQNAGYDNEEIEEGIAIVYENQINLGKESQSIELPNSSEKIQDVESAEDIEKNKGIAGVAYFFWIVPLLTDQRNSDFVKFHLNQGFVLHLIAGISFIALWFISFFGAMFLGFIPFIGILGILLFPLMILLVGALIITTLVFMIKGVISASHGKKEKLPIIGDIHIFDR